MTQEEKAKAYDEALEKARKYRDEEGFTEMEDVFPELRESEDERMLHQVLRYLDPTLPRAKREEIELWLKFLRPSWKPSEEQMYALGRASTNEYLSAEQYDILVSLYEHLKKLM